MIGAAAVKTEIKVVERTLKLPGDGIKIRTAAIPNLPWEHKPAGYGELVWRYSANPIIDRHPVPRVQSVYNSAVHPFDDRFVGVFRADHKTRMPHLHVGWSDDGLNWDISNDPIQFTGADPDIAKMEYSYDPRITKLDDCYYIQWCNGYHGPTIGLARTRDFLRFEQMENAFLPYNRNGALFPRKIDGRYAMLSRPSDLGHTPFGDIFYSESPDLVFWGKHRHVMSRGTNWWQDTKIGAGPSPIETSEGWLLFYHGVLNSCNGFVYSTGVALLDLERPWKVLYRSSEHILTPEADYETTGNTPNVVFPTTALCDAPTGRIALYCGAADTFTSLAFTNVFELIPWLKTHSQV
jgi:beta-1,4-mannooligosaccharide/beta-1,4-mannosyl-N-acetylglucosamine phosphorylase